jgi:hypothetical protein
VRPLSPPLSHAPFGLSLTRFALGKGTTADHCSIEVVRAAGGSRSICISSNNASDGADVCTVSVEAFEKRNPQTILLSLQLHAHIAHSDFHP